MMTSLLHTVTDFCSSRRGKFVTILLWLIVAALLSSVAPKLATLYDNTIGQRIPSDADSQVASRLLQQTFPGSRGTPAILVFYDPGRLGVEDRIRIKQVSDWLISREKPTRVGPVVSVFTVPQAATQLISQDGTTMTLIALLTGSASDQATQDSVKAIRQYLRNATVSSPLQALLTGPAGILTDATTVFSSVDVALLLTTIGLVFVLLIVLYRSPILALLPILDVGIALQVVNALLGFGARAGLFSISSMSGQIATVLLFGAGTDYSIFIASRFREELQHTQDKHRAMQQTMRAVGEAITSSAATVFLALLTLLFATLGLYSALGPTLAIAILVMLLAGLTLVPALMTCFGRVAYWPFIPRYQADLSLSAQRAQGFWGRLGQWTVRHRILAVGSSTLLLILLALGSIGSQPSFNFLTAFRVPTDSSRGFALLQQHFPAGTLAPTTVLIQLHGKTPDAYQHLSQIDAITAALQKAPGVAAVRGPTRPDGAPSTTDPATLQAEIAALPPALRDAIRTGSALAPCTGPTCPQHNPQFFATIGAYAASIQYVSPDTTTVQLSVILQDDPYSLTAIDRVPELRAMLNKTLAANDLGPDTDTSATFHLDGQTAQLADTLGYNLRDTWLIVPAVLALVLLVLALLLRSLIAPLYLLGAVTLNFLAAIGVCSFVFQRVQGQDGFNYAIPLYTFVFLVALGADYTIFLMSRVREEIQRRGLEQGVPFALSRTGGVITSAGLILAGTFLVLTTLPLTILYQLGVCVAVGILMDTFVVRGLLVPGMVALLGRWNWWPGSITPPLAGDSGHDQSIPTPSAPATTKQPS
ncbi:MAG TPA: MMPL family transporter [Ktedonosporobacter sp.]|nr:MMPL family transporter [Ktedonosporobacter sp.]